MILIRLSIMILIAPRRRLPALARATGPKIAPAAGVRDGQGGSIDAAARENRLRKIYQSTFFPSAGWLFTSGNRDKRFRFKVDPMRSTNVLSIV
jgi:hypothetical protein